MGMALKIQTILLERDMSIKELSAITEGLNCDYDGIFTYRDTVEKV